MSEENLISTFTGLRTRLLRMAMRFLPSADDADDVLQEAFCRLWPRADTFETQQQTEAMTVTTIRNLCIDEIRRRDKVDVVEFDSERDSRLSDSPLEELERKEQFRLLEEVMERELSPAQRQILRMREYEDLEMDEIARRMEMTSANVRMNLSRARKRIREVYQERRNHYAG